MDLICPDCSWSKTLESVTGDIQQFCDDCGASLDVDHDYSNPGETKSDMV